MKLVEKYPILGSSKNPEELSLMIKGFLLAILPIALMIIRANNLPVTEDDVMGIIETITGLVSGVAILWGFARKFID